MNHIKVLRDARKSYFENNNNLSPLEYSRKMVEDVTRKVEKGSDLSK
jgi:hypothetical protein